MTPIDYRRALRLLAPCVLLAIATAGAAQTAPSDAPNPYTAETTYRKLVGKYPYIRIASGDAPAGIQVIKNIRYSGTDAAPLELDLYLPRPVENKTAPAIVLVHGGGWRDGERANLGPMALRMAERGYAAATVSYRLSRQAPYPAAIHDVKAAVRWLRANAGKHAIDPQRFAIAGGSAGGQIASLVGVTNGQASFDPGAGGAAVSSEVQVVINIDGLSDFTSEAARVNEDDAAKKPSAAGAWFGGRYADKRALWHEASPITHAGKATPPMLFIGSAQTRFSVGREEMIVKMAGHGVPSKVVLLPDTPHSFWLFDPWLGPTVDVMADFLGQHLAGQTKQLP